MVGVCKAESTLFAQVFRGSSGAEDAAGSAGAHAGHGGSSHKDKDKDKDAAASSQSHWQDSAQQAFRCVHATGRCVVPSILTPRSGCVCVQRYAGGLVRAAL
jgi:hypothetical protein